MGKLHIWVGSSPSAILKFQTKKACRCPHIVIRAYWFPLASGYLHMPVSDFFHFTLSNHESDYRELACCWSSRVLYQVLAWQETLQLDAHASHWAGDSSTGRPCKLPCKHLVEDPWAPATCRGGRHKWWVGIATGWVEDEYPNLRFCSSTPLCFISPFYGKYFYLLLLFCSLGKNFPLSLSLSGK